MTLCLILNACDYLTADTDKIPFIISYVVKYVHFLDEREYPYRVTLIRREEFHGFGLCLKSAVTSISQIIQGSPIEVCGLIKVGDLVTEINGINISLMFKNEIDNIVMETGDTLVLTIGGMYRTRAIITRS